MNPQQQNVADTVRKVKLLKRYLNRAIKDMNANEVAKIVVGEFRWTGNGKVLRRFL